MLSLQKSINKNILKIAVVLSHIPYPLVKGEQVRAFNQMRILSRNHDIYLFIVSQDQMSAQAQEALAKITEEITFFKLSGFSVFFNKMIANIKGLPLLCSRFFNAGVYTRLNRKLDELKPDVIYNQLITTTEYTKNRKERKILDYQNVFSKDLWRFMEKTNKTANKKYLKRYKRLQKYESDIFKYFDEKTIITQVDRDWIQHHWADSIVVVPNGVDMSYFSPQNTEKQYDIIFTGNMSYLPNVLACEYIVKEILPQLLQKYADIKIVLCGVNPSPRVLALKNTHVEVTGYVEDIRDYYAKSKLFLAPLEIGSGLQNKLLEAMAMKLPCIASPLASEPLKADANRDILICNSVLGYVDAIDNLLQNKDLYNSIAENAFRFVQQHYNWEHTTAILNNLIVNPSDNAAKR